MDPTLMRGLIPRSLNSQQAIAEMFLLGTQMSEKSESSTVSQDWMDCFCSGHCTTDDSMDALKIPILLNARLCTRAYDDCTKQKTLSRTSRK